MPHVHASVSVTSEPTTADVLRDVRDLLADPARWIRESFALVDREITGDALYGNEAGATCFCILGALQRVVGAGPVSTRNHPAKHLIERAIANDPRAVTANDSTPRIPTFNDHPETRHVDILDALDRAVSAAVLAETK